MLLAPREWAVLAFALLAVIHLVPVVYLYWRGDRELRPDGDRNRTGRVRCSDCGVENQTEFRYCRRCASDLRHGPPTGEETPPRGSSGTE